MAKLPRIFHSVFDLIFALVLDFLIPGAMLFGFLYLFLWWVLDDTVVFVHTISLLVNWLF